MPGVKADHRQAYGVKRMPVPGGERAALQANADHIGGAGLDGGGNSLGGRSALPLPDGLAVARNDAEMGGALGYVEADKLFDGSISIDGVEAKPAAPCFFLTAVGSEQMFTVGFSCSAITSCVSVADGRDYHPGPL
jgi:hypothetical protein